MYRLRNGCHNLEDKALPILYDQYHDWWCPVGTRCQGKRRRGIGLVHDDVIKWKHFPRYRPFVCGIHRSQRPVTRSLDVFFDLRLNKRLSKQWWGWRFEMLSRSLWRHCNVPWNTPSSTPKGSISHIKCETQSGYGQLFHIINTSTGIITAK